ncbi:MAG: helix-turn-helix domain-containing protein [Gemmataceae bacterium]
MGNVLTQIRNQQGLHQGELAAAVGVTQATWSRIENGQTSITVEHLRLAGNTLGRMPGEILSMADSTATMMEFNGIEVVPTRVNENLKSALILIGAVAITAFVTTVVMKSARQG